MGWTILAILVALCMVGARWRSFYDSKKDELNAAGAFGAFVKYCLILVPCALMLSAMTFVTFGQRGVVFDTFRGVRPRPLGEGASIIVPFIQTVYKMNVQVQKETFKAAAASSDLQEVHTAVTLNYRILPDATPELFQTVGLDYSDKLIGPAVQEVVKARTAQYKAEQLIAVREAVKQGIHEALCKLLTKHGIQLTETYLTDFSFSPSYTQAIEAKQVAEQEAQKASRVLQQKEFEAKQKIVMAKAEAESLRLQKENLSGPLIELRKIEMATKMVEKWDGKFPTVMTGGGTNLFDMTSMMKQAKGE